MTAPVLPLYDGKSIDVLALGAAIVDVLAHVDEPFLEAQGVAKAGMTLVDTAVAERIHAAMPSAREVSGGSAANTAAGLAALGARVAFVGKTRDDVLGRVFRDDIRRAGVQFHTEPFAADAAGFGGTARSMIMVTPDAQRSMATDLGVSGHLSQPDLPLEAIADAKIVYLEGYLWDREPTKDAFRGAAAAAQAAHGRVALTLSDTFCVERHRDSFLELVSGQVDILFANEAEILSLYQTEDLEAALAAASAAAPVVVVTRSEKGCVAIAGARRAEAPAEPIEALVDTTGAGDLFASGFLYGVVDGRDLADCCALGCKAAAVVIQQLGARPAADLRPLAG